MEVPRCFSDIRGCAALTREFINNMRSQTRGNPVPKRKEYHYSLCPLSLLSLCAISLISYTTIRFVPRPTVRLSSFFSFRDRIPTRLRSHLVYKFTCQGCVALYVGETSRHLHTRVSDHLEISTFTGKKWKCPSPTAILSHHGDTGHSIPFDNFKIISSCYSVSELLLRESLLIPKLNPSFKC